MKKQTSRTTKSDDSDDQRRRFIDAARQAECDETGKVFEKALKKIVPPKGINTKQKAANLNNATAT